jgi:signal transduction histidine kinase
VPLATRLDERPGIALWAAVLGFGVAATWFGSAEPAALDGLTGFALAGLGLAAWTLRPRSRAGALMAAAGVAWFMGSLVGWALYLHRGPLAHLLLTYPSGRTQRRSERAAIALAYAYAAVYPLAGDDRATFAFGLGLVALAARRFAVAAGPERRARAAALAATTAFGLVLAGAAAGRLAGLENVQATLWAYDVVVALIGVGLFADLVWGRWAASALTGVVIDLGDPAGAGTLRDRLARTLGDPTLAVGYWLPDEGRYVDETGRPFLPPGDSPDRATTPIAEDGRPLAVLVHDPALLDDPLLASTVASATRLAVANARLQAEVRERVAQVDASRRRIVEAADEQRARLARELRAGPEQRLSRVAELVGGLDPELASQLEAARGELDRLARGIRPPALTERGLAAALDELADRSPLPVSVAAPDRRFPDPVEAAAYFTCSEALANVAKHAQATRASIRVQATEDMLAVEIADDGVGGADASRGSGLSGLVDRVEALGGRLEVESRSGAGTRVLARLPSGASSTVA